MNYTTITQPTIEPITLNELKQYLRITHDSEDGILTNFICTAREMVEQSTHHMLLERRISLHIPFDVRSPKIRLMQGRTGVLMPLGPVKAVHHVHSILVDGRKILLPRSQYQWNQNGSSNILITQSEDGVAMTIDCTVGYGPELTDVPALLRHTVLEWAAYLYEHRAMQDPPIFNRIWNVLGKYRPWRMS